MGIEEDFNRVTDEVIDGDGNDLMPTSLAIAAARVLPVDGASISIAYDGYRVPLGASDERSAEAERLQFTVGDGPCMTAIDDGTVISVSEQQLHGRWPELADLWHERTGFRAAASCPLIDRGHIHAALNLFFLDSDGNLQLNADDLASVGRAATTRLSHALGPDLVVAPGASAERRRQIWVAVGMGMNRWNMLGPDALARLRAHAYGRNTTVDELANQLVNDPSVLDEL